MNKALLSSEKMDWCTPQDVFDELNSEFCFTLDAAASEQNAKCKKYYTEETDGLAHSWRGETVFCNPPYGREIEKWVRKGCTEGTNGATVVMLIPARTDTSYWHEYIFGKAEIRFLRGRIRFEDCDGKKYDAAPFPSAVVIWR